MLRLFGHSEVALLDGGLPKWKAEGRPLDTAIPAPPPRRFTARFDPALVRDKAVLIGNLATGAEQVLDARNAGRFAGTTPESRPGLRCGHIPGSRNLPYEELTDPRTHQLRNADELSRLFDAAGVAPRPADRDQLRLGRHRLRTRLCPASDRPSRRRGL